MTLTGAVVIPSTPLLVPELAGGSSADDAALRACVVEEVFALTRGQARVVVVGEAPGGRHEGTWDWSGFGLPPTWRRDSALPLSLALGAWLLDQVGFHGERHCLGAPSSYTPKDCLDVGGRLVADRDLVLLVVGDGTARRSEKAPGAFDPRAHAYDVAAAAALASGDPETVLALDAHLGRDLMAAGRAPWQVLAGAASGRTWRAALRWEDAPYGVCYLVATWLPG